MSAPGGTDPRLGLALDSATARDLLGLRMPPHVEDLRGANHHWRITAGEEVFYLKAHTRPWYDWDPLQAASLAVRQETTGYRLLQEAGIAVPEVAAAFTDTDNPLGWPCLATRALDGRALTDVVKSVDEGSAHEALRTAGAYLSRLHAITFEVPGYLIDGPPAFLPDPAKWQSPAWTPEAFLASAIARLGPMLAEAPRRLALGVAALVADAAPQLDRHYRPPRFITGDCHAGHLFLQRTDGHFSVTGIVDLELASSGAPLADLFKTTVQLAALPGTPERWWESLFEGYGQPPSLAVLKLFYAAAGIENYKCFGADSWPGTDLDILEHATTASSLSELFDTRRLLAIQDG